MSESKLKTLWAELRRRKVIRAALVYVVVAWVVLEAASVIFPQLLLPDWSVRLVLALALLGFPLAMVLAWAFDLSPDGLQRDQVDAPARPPPIATGDGWQAAPVSSRQDERRAIAVLPLANMSGDPENEFFSDGITEELLNLLAKQPELRVVSRTSSFAFKNTHLDVPAIARKLGVDIVLEGSVRRAGNRVRIVAQLIDASSDAHLWSDIYDRELEDIFAVQIEIAKCIVDAMNLQAAKDIDCDCTTDNVSAYDYYLRGRQYFHGLIDRSLGFAREMFQKAIDIDPTFARAWAGLANVECIVAQWIDPDPRHIEAADRASRKALELAPHLAEAHSSRGFTLTLKGDYAGSAKEFEAALKIDPTNYDALYLYGRSRFAEGNQEHAAELWSRAHDAQPDEFQSVSLREMALRGLGRNEEARKSAEQALALIQRRLSLNPDDLRALTMGAGNLIKLGRVEEGLKNIEHAIRLAPNDSGVLYMAACNYALAGETDKSLAALEKRVELGGRNFKDWVVQDSDFDSIRDDPRFLKLLADPSTRT